MDKGKCRRCNLENPPYLHHVYHKDYYDYFQVCTSCILNMHPGAFCPICFEVYDPENPNPSSDQLVNCHSCPAISHLSCINPKTASASTSFTIPIVGVPYICRSCADPNFKFFNLGTNEKNMLLTDEHLANQLIAASVISQRTMKEAAELHRHWAEIKAEQAEQARKEAKRAMDILAQMTTPIIIVSSSSEDASNDSNSGSSNSRDAPNDSNSGYEAENSESARNDSISSSSHSGE